MMAMQIRILDLSETTQYVLSPWEPGKLINIIETLPF